MLIAVISVPIMLFPKPYILKARWEKRMQARGLCARSVPMYPHSLSRILFPGLAPRFKGLP